MYQWNGEVILEYCVFNKGSGGHSERRRDNEGRYLEHLKPTKDSYRKLIRGTPTNQQGGKAGAPKEKWAKIKANLFQRRKQKRLINM